MQLPQDLQHFPHLTLIVLSDHGTSKLYLAGGESLEELDGVSLPAEPLPDHEGSFVPGSNFIESDRLEKYAKLLAEHVSQLVQTHAVKHMHFIMPADIEKLVSASLPVHVQEKILKRLALDVMNESPIDAVRRLMA